MDRGKLLAIITGAISILIAIAYLIVVQLLRFSWRDDSRTSEL